MSRFTTASFTTSSVAGSGGTLLYELVVLANVIDISRLKVTPSVASGENIVGIYNAASLADSQMIYCAKFTASEWNDPADNAGAEVKQGFVIPYYDPAEALKVYFKFTNNHTSAKTYDVEVDYEYASTDEDGVVGAPEELLARAVANGLQITTGCVAGRNNATITEGEFRATRIEPDQDNLVTPQDLRTVAEGGSWIPDGVDNLQITSITAGPGGAQYIWTSADPGRWYYAWRLKNSVGWSRWTDGNVTPQYVRQYVDTQDASLADTGPPADWEVWLEEGPNTGSIVVHATRPQTNGRNLLWWLIQIKDADTGSWIALDDGAAPSEVIYDGSAINHTLSGDRLTISKASGNYGAAAAGDLILLDVRGSQFNVNYCQWAMVETVSGTSLTFTTPGLRPQTYSNLRLKIVTPPWAWNSNGYLGDEENNGMWPSGAAEDANSGLGLGWIFGDYTTQEFVSPPIQIPSTITNPEARVWFENIYCRSDNDLTHSSGISGGTGVFVAPRVFTNFNNREYWLPVYPPATWGTLSCSTDNTVTMATGTDQSEHVGHSGVRGRFRIYPDAAGIFQVYAKFTDVTLPVGIASTNFLGLGIFLLGLRRFDHSTTGVGFAVKGTDAARVTFDAPFIEYRRIQDTGTKDNVSYVRNPSVNRPANGSTIEFRCTAQKRGTSVPIFQINPIEYRINESGSYVSAATSYPREGWTLAHGVEVFLGFVGDCRLTGATATLETFTMLQGLAEII